MLRFASDACICRTRHGMARQHRTDFRALPNPFIGGCSSVAVGRGGTLSLAIPAHTHLSVGYGLWKPNLQSADCIRIVDRHRSLCRSHDLCL